MVQEQVKRFEFIDALRGFAILGVILVHTSQWIKPSSEFFSAVSVQGARGVQLFFMASALTLFLSLTVRRKSDTRPYLSYALRRFFRIAPLFYVAIAVYLLFYGMGPRYWAPEGIEWWSLPLTALFLHGWHPETITSVVPGGWSIAVEMTFYLIVPLLFLHLRNIKTALLALFVAIAGNWFLSSGVAYLLSPHYAPDQQYMVDGFTFFWFFSQLPVFLLGIVLFHLMTRYQNHQSKNAGASLIVAGVFLWFALVDLKTFGSQVPTHVFYGLSFLLFSLGLYFYPAPLLVNRLTRGLGRISFSLYLTHFAVIYILRDYIVKDSLPHGDWQLLAAFALVLALSAAASICSYLLVEKPGVAFGARLVERVNRPPHKQTPESPKPLTVFPESGVEEATP